MLAVFAGCPSLCCTLRGGPPSFASCSCRPARFPRVFPARHSATVRSCVIGQRHRLADQQPMLAAFAGCPRICITLRGGPPSFASCSCRPACFSRVFPVRSWRRGDPSRACACRSLVQRVVCCMFCSGFLFTSASHLLSCAASLVVRRVKTAAPVPTGWEHTVHTPPACATSASATSKSCDILRHAVSPALALSSSSVSRARGHARVPARHCNRREAGRRAAQ